MTEDQIMGWTPAQWCTVVQRFPPPEANLKGMAKSRRDWMKSTTKQPAAVDPQSKAAYHMGKFLLRAMGNSERRT